MGNVHVMCTETRFVGNDRYIAGVDYHLPAERAGKYSAYFDPISDNDRVDAEAAWQNRLAQVQEEAETQRFLANVDPSIVKAAVRAVQGEIEESIRLKIAAATKIASPKAAAAAAASAGATS